MDKKQSRRADRRLRDLRIRRVRRITGGRIHHRAPVFSACGRLVASAHGDDHDTVWLITDRKGRVVRFLEGPVEGGASFSPDGSLAYGRQVGATAEIWLLPAGGARPRRLLGGDGRLYRDPAFSPDGRYLCYAADGGSEDARPDGALRLWLLDLSRDEHTLLVGDDAIEEVSPPAPFLVSRPAWSPTSEAIYFEATTGEDTSLRCLDLASRRVSRLTDTGYRRPAPLGDGLVLCERVAAAGQTALALLEHRPPGAAPREERSGRAAAKIHDLPLRGRADCAREPAVVRSRKGALLIAWSMPCTADLDEPQRCDIHVGELSGIEGRIKRRAESRPQADPEDRGEAAAPAAAAEYDPLMRAAEPSPHRPAPERPLTIGAALADPPDREDAARPGRS